MKYSYAWLSDLVKKIPPAGVVADLLTLHAFQVENVSRAGSDTVFDIDVLPNRLPDASGHLGVAREIAVLAKTSLRAPTHSLREGTTLTKKLLTIEVRSKGAFRYIASVLESAQIKESPRFVGERLAVLGLRPINTIVDSTNYIMMETGYPTHAFDYDKIEGKKIIVREAKDGETMETIDGAVVKLTASYVVIADAKGPLAIAGVKGGKRAEITGSTTRVVFETAVFDRTRVRKASQDLGIVTDASRRFSAGLSPRRLDEVANRLRGFAKEISGGVLSRGLVDVSRSLPKQPPLVLRFDRLASLLGISIPEKEAADILVRLGFLITSKKGKVIITQPPPWREDIVYEEDLVEEVGRVYGYDHIKPVAPHATLLHPQDSEEHRFADLIREHVRASKFMEVSNYIFVEKGAVESEALELVNPTSQAFAYLRTSMAPSMLATIEKNILRTSRLRFFEIGKVFTKGAKGPEECLMLAGAVAGASRKSELYFEAKGVVEALFKRFGLGEMWFEPLENRKTSWPLSLRELAHPYRSALLKIDETTVGFLFEAHPDLGLKTKAVVFEIVIPIFFKEARDEYEFKPIPRYPTVVRDLALVVDRDEHAHDVESVFEDAGGELLMDTELFDWYEDEMALGEDKKSLAFHLVFQKEDRTLRDEEVDEAVGKIKKAAAANGWEVRE